MSGIHGNAVGRLPDRRPEFIFCCAGTLADGERLGPQINAQADAEKTQDQNQCMYK